MCIRDRCKENRFRYQQNREHRAFHVVQLRLCCVSVRHHVSAQRSSHICVVAKVVVFHPQWFDYLASIRILTKHLERCWNGITYIVSPRTRRSRQVYDVAVRREQSQGCGDFLIAISFEPIRMATKFDATSFGDDDLHKGSCWFWRRSLGA